MEPRWYQKEAIDAAGKAIKAESASIIAMPTGSGKTPTLTGVTENFLINHRKRVLVLSHVEEILRQNYNTLVDALGGIVGIYSASMSSRESKNPVVVAGIQSIYNKPELFVDVGLIIIDEAHLVNHNNKGMYREFINELEDLIWGKVPIIGLTATPFRLGHGYIYEGENALFDNICYDCTGVEKYNRLVEEGYLAKIYSKGTDFKLDVSGVRTTGGDFNSGDLSDKIDQTDITERALKETIQYGERYKKWLIFAIDIEHAEHIAEYLNKQGIPTSCVHSRMEESRAVEIARFKRGDYRALVNVDILTTGFDETRIDLIAMLRPTQSPIIHVQTVGRGARVHPEKDHCLFLDFAGNTERLGPINDVQVKSKKKKTVVGEPITKTCPECGVIHHPTVKECDACGHEFEFKTKLQETASNTDVVAATKTPIPTSGRQNIKVNSVSYSIHQKAGKTDSLRVTYKCGLRSYSEWIAYGRPGRGGEFARHWVKFRWLGSINDLPKNTGQLYAVADKMLRKPKYIKVDFSGQYDSIVDASFGDRLAS